VIAAITTIAAILAVGVLAAITHYDTYSSRPLAEALRARMAPGEPLVSLRVYRFDLPLYARWPEPIPVLHSWNDPALRQQDSWPRELADAGDFDRATGERVLIDVSRLREVLCAQPVTWVVAHAKDKEPLLEGAQRVAANPHYALMRVERSGLDCGLAR
jgi:hypothetical protein